MLGRRSAHAGADQLPRQAVPDLSGDQPGLGAPEPVATTTVRGVISASSPARPAPALHRRIRSPGRCRPAARHRVWPPPLHEAPRRAPRRRRRARPGSRPRRRADGHLPPAPARRSLTEPRAARRETGGHSPCPPRGGHGRGRTEVRRRAAGGNEDVGPLGDRGADQELQGRALLPATPKPVRSSRLRKIGPARARAPGAARARAGSAGARARPGEDHVHASGSIDRACAGPGDDVIDHPAGVARRQVVHASRSCSVAAPRRPARRDTSWTSRLPVRAPRA